jgi:hypothetical protein
VWKYWINNAQLGSSSQAAPSADTNTGSQYVGLIQVASGSITVSSGGSGTPISTIQPTLTANCMIRVLALLELTPLPSLPANDNQFAAIEPPARRSLGEGGRRLAA